MIKVGIIGATGYAGAELVRILTGHPGAQIEWYGSRSYIDQKYADVYSFRSWMRPAWTIIWRNLPLSWM